MVFELYYGKQEYIEDCEVCCNPIQINYTADGEAIVDFEASRLE
jgi:hypothetical protein